MTRSRSVRLVCGSAVLFGVGMLVRYAVDRAGAVGIDYRVYHVAAVAAREGRDFYAVSPPGSDFHYLYPPVTVLAFYPSTLADGWVPGYLALTLLSVLASVVAARTLCRYVAALGYDVPLLDRVLVGAFLLVSSHAVPSLAYGQVNHLLVAAVVVGLAWLGRTRDGVAGSRGRNGAGAGRAGASEAETSGREWRAGVVLALPAFVKVFPGAVGLWLLRRRAWRAIAAAVGTAIALTAAGLATFGVDTYRTYVLEAVLGRRETDAFVGGLAPGKSFVTLRRPLSVAFPGVDPVWYAVGAAALLAPVLAALYWRPTTTTDRHVAVHGTLVAMLLWFPSLLIYYAYLAFPLVVLLYDLPSGRGRQLFVAGALLANPSLAFDGFQTVLGALPLDAATAGAVAGTVRPVFAVGTSVLYGCVLMLAGCVVYRVESGAFARSVPERFRRDRHSQ